MLSGRMLCPGGGVEAQSQYGMRNLWTAASSLCLSGPAGHHWIMSSIRFVRTCYRTESAYLKGRKTVPYLPDQKLGYLLFVPRRALDRAGAMLETRRRNGRSNLSSHSRGLVPHHARSYRVRHEFLGRNESRGKEVISFHSDS